MTPGRRLYAPRRVRVEADPAGAPLAVAGIAVEAVRERWWVEDRWWTSRPLSRHYFELVLEDGRDVTLFRSGTGEASRWFRQRA